MHAAKDLPDESRGLRALGAVVFSPSACTSVRNTSRPAKCCPPWTMPRRVPCSIAFVVSAPALAKPMILACDACASSRNEEKSEVGNGWRIRPSTLPPWATTTASVSRSSVSPNV
jgi:hypothetical protein